MNIFVDDNLGVILTEGAGGLSKDYCGVNIIYGNDNNHTF